MYAEHPGASRSRRCRASFRLALGETEAGHGLFDCRRAFGEVFDDLRELLRVAGGDARSIAEHSQRPLDLLSVLALRERRLRDVRDAVTEAFHPPAFGPLPGRDALELSRQVSQLIGGLLDALTGPALFVGGRGDLL